MNKLKEMLKSLKEMFSYIFENYIEMDMCDHNEENNKDNE